MNRISTVFVTALPILVGCDGLPAPAQYDHAMLRGYFGKSPAEVHTSRWRRNDANHLVRLASYHSDNLTAPEKDKAEFSNVDDYTQ